MPELTPEQISKTKEITYKKFPEMAGVEPTTSTEEAQGQGGKSPQPHYVLTFQKNISLPDGGGLKRVVRVTVDQTGEIIKIASSK